MFTFTYNSLVVHRTLSVRLPFPSIVHRKLTCPSPRCRPLADAAMSTLVMRLAWFYPSCALVVLLTPFADSFARLTSSRARHATSCVGHLALCPRASGPRAHHAYVPLFSNASSRLDYHVSCIPFIQFYFSSSAATLVETTSPLFHHLSHVVRWGALAFLRASRPSLRLIQVGRTFVARFGQGLANVPSFIDIIMWTTNISLSRLR